jgi:hypothetical protein
MAEPHLLAEDIRYILTKHMHRGHVYDINEIDAMVVAEDALSEADLESWRGNQAVWQHRVRAVLQRLKANGELEHVGSASSAGRDRSSEWGVGFDVRYPPPIAATATGTALHGVRDHAATPQLPPRRQHWSGPRCTNDVPTPSVNRAGNRVTAGT